MKRSSWIPWRIAFCRWVIVLTENHFVEHPCGKEFEFRLDAERWIRLSDLADGDL